MRGERYQMGKIVGTGAFATVHEATDLRLDSIVAIKVLAQNWAADPSVCERFGREATLLRRVRSRHRNAPLAEVFDIDQADDGRPYFVMSFADRGTLSARITPGQPWPPDQVRPIINTLTDGLHALHSEGVVHRDIKPSNMLYVSQPSAPSGEELLIGDLGLAKDTFTATSELTVAGGTPGYMAPEQRFPDSKITPAADIFSSTVLIAELLTGVRGPGAVNALPVATRLEFERGTYEDPASRHGSMVEWRERMLATLDHGDQSTTLATAPLSHSLPPPPPASAQPTSQSDVVDGPRSSRRGLVALAGLVAAVLIAGLVGFAALRGGSDIDIDGPTSTSVGNTIFLRPELPTDAQSHSWSVGGQTVTDADLRLTPTSTGTIEVELNVRMADGALESTTHQIEVS